MKKLIFACALISSLQLSTLAQTRSAVMVTNATGKLAGPTNFFAANSNLLNQAVAGGGGGGGDGTNFVGSYDGFFGTNSLLQITLGTTWSNLLNGLAQWSAHPSTNDFVASQSGSSTAQTLHNATNDSFFTSFKPGGTTAAYDSEIIDGFMFHMQNIYFTGAAWALKDTNAGWAMERMQGSIGGPGQIAWATGPATSGVVDPVFDLEFHQTSTQGHSTFIVTSTNVDQPRGITSRSTNAGPYAGSFMSEHAEGPMDAGSALANWVGMGAYCFAGWDGTTFADHQALIEAFSLFPFTASMKACVIAFGAAPISNTNVVYDLVLGGDTNMSFGTWTNPGPANTFTVNASLATGSNVISGNGSGLTNLNASALASGKVPDAVMPNTPAGSQNLSNYVYQTYIATASYVKNLQGTAIGLTLSGNITNGPPGSSGGATNAGTNTWAGANTNIGTMTLNGTVTGTGLAAFIQSFTNLITGNLLNWAKIPTNQLSGGSQTPWTSDISGGGYNLTNANAILQSNATGTVALTNGNLIASGSVTVTGTATSAGQINSVTNGVIWSDPGGFNKIWQTNVIGVAAGGSCNVTNLDLASLAGCMSFQLDITWCCPTNLAAGFGRALIIGSTSASAGGTPSTTVAISNAAHSVTLDISNTTPTQHGAAGGIYYLTVFTSTTNTCNITITLKTCLRP